MKIYSVGVIKADTSENARSFIKDQRLWYLYSKFEDAEKCVLENHSDIFEYYYNYAVIEETYVHDYTNPPEAVDTYYLPKQHWYFADFSSEGNRSPYPLITKVETPKCMENICCIWVG